MSSDIAPIPVAASALARCRIPTRTLLASVNSTAIARATNSRRDGDHDERFPGKRALTASGPAAGSGLRCRRLLPSRASVRSLRPGNSKAKASKPARTSGWAHPGLHRRPDDLRAAPQRPSAAAPRQPPLRADRPRPADRRLLHEDLHPHPQPRPYRIRPHPRDEIAHRSPLARAWRAFEQALEARVAAAQLIA